MNAYFAGGCFWCITPVFRDTPGVQRVISGYCGGKEKDPRYEDVKAQRTGHRETIAVQYDPSLVSYADLLDLFLSVTDPFDSGGQFIDRGRSYTLAVFCSNEEERLLAEEKIRQLEARSGKQVFVSVENAAVFYPAEEYHQDYDLKNPEAYRQELVSSGRVKD